MPFNTLITANTNFNNTTKIVSSVENFVHLRLTHVTIIFHVGRIHTDTSKIYRSLLNLSFLAITFLL